MAKTTVSTITSDIKAIVDYDITDTDLDNLILKHLNYAVKRMKKWFLNEGYFDEIGASDSFSTTANQEYIDIATETIDFDQPIVLTERTNDNPITLVSFKEYRERFPDPSIDKSATPDIAAFFANRLYLGPTPSGVITIYSDYVKTITKMTSSSSLPYEDEYDELVSAIVVEKLVAWFDRKDRAAIVTAREEVKMLKDELIVMPARNIGMNQQVQSRREERPYFSPKKVIN